MLNYLKCLFQLILSPIKGWEDISHEGEKVRKIATSGFYPLTAIVALTCFLRLLYSSENTFTTTSIDAIITFIKYFITYFIAQFVFSLKLPEYIDGEVNYKRTHTFILYSTGLLALTGLIKNLLPLDLGITDFFPIYVAIIMWKGTRYMAVKAEKTGSFMVMSLLSIIAPPYIIGFIFGILH